MVKEGFCFDGRIERHGVNGGLLISIRSLDYIVKPIGELLMVHLVMNLL